MLPANCPPWKNPRIVLLLCMVFLSGSLAGALAMKLWRPNKIVTAQPADVLSPEEVKNNSRRALERFRTALNLDGEQTKAFEQILDDYGMYYHTLQAQMAEWRADGRNKMLKILNEEQRRKFTQMGAELERKAFR